MGYFVNQGILNISTAYKINSRKLLTSISDQAKILSHSIVNKLDCYRQSILNEQGMNFCEQIA